MSDNKDLNLAVKLFKEKQEELKRENVMAKKWAAASLCSTQKGNSLYTKSFKF